MAEDDQRNAIYLITASELMTENIGMTLLTERPDGSGYDRRGVIDSIASNTNHPWQVAVGVDQRDMLLLRKEQNVIVLHPNFWPTDFDTLTER